MNDAATLTIPALPLPYYLGSGQSRYMLGDQHPNRRSIGVYDLIVVESGRLHMGEDADEWSIGPGDMLLLHPDRHHYPLRPCDEETRFYWLHFQAGTTAPGHTLAPASASASDSLPYQLRLPRYWNLPFPAETYKRFQKLLQLATERRSDAFWQEQTAFLELIRQIEQSRAVQESSRTLAVAEMTESYIKRNYRQPLNNSILSADLHYHYNYLTSCMKEAYGLSPMEYLLKTRLEQARLLLLKTDWPIATIAEHIGFEYAPYFSRCFSAHYGISPLRFRKSFLK